MTESQRIEVAPLSDTGALEAFDAVDATQKHAVHAALPPAAQASATQAPAAQPPATQPHATQTDVLLERTPADLDRPPPGTVLDDRYEVGGLLGQGGMGYVLAARHVVLGTRLALKVLRPELTREGEMVERFRREARAASAIGHPNIVDVRDFGTLPAQAGKPGASYFVMEHLEGKSLAEVLDDGPLSIERAVDVVRQMADALGAAHARGIVHRDVKPENVILIVRNGRPDHVKILDFGIAKLDSATRLSGAFVVLGTPAYMSPEQAQGKTLDARSDVYSLGIVLYELLTGNVPFDDSRPFEVLRMQVSETPKPIEKLRSDVPDVVAELIGRMLQKDPNDRPESMRAVVEVLAPIAASRSIEWQRTSLSLPPVSVSSPTILAVPPMTLRPAPTERLPQPVATSPAPRPRSIPVWAIAAAAITVVIVIAAGVFLELEALRTRLAPVPIAMPLPPAPVLATPAPPPVLAAPPVAIEAPTTTPLPVVPTTPAHVHPAPAHAPIAVVEAPPVVAAQPVAAPVAADDTRPTAQVIDPWN
jgi:serine/threonine-protein kinase